MPKYRIPIQGALLIEADSEHQARIMAGMWTVSVRQMTQGVPVQDCLGILASHVTAEKQNITEISEAFSAKKKQLEPKYGGFPKQFAEVYTNYFVGEQMWFELFEMNWK